MIRGKEAGLGFAPTIRGDTPPGKARSKETNLDLSPQTIDSPTKN